MAHAIELLLRLAERLVVKVDFIALLDDTFDTVKETRDGFESVVVPRAAFDIVETEHEIHSEYIRAVFCDTVVGRYDVAARF